MVRRVIWVGSSRRDLKALSSSVKDEMGFALYHAQLGLSHPAIKPLKGLGSGVAEIVVNDVGGTFRGVYTIRFGEWLYVLHVFQKKSTEGGKTPKHHVDLIKQRLSLAERDYHTRRAANESD